MAHRHSPRAPRGQREKLIQTGYIAGSAVTGVVTVLLGLAYTYSTPVPLPVPAAGPVSCAGSTAVHLHCPHDPTGTTGQK